jgi:hypothetical protein
MPSLIDIFFSPPVYMAPTIVAFFYKKRASPLLYIFFINLLLGWTFMGWLVSWMLIVRSEASLRSSSRASPQGQPALANLGAFQPDMACSSCSGSGRTQCLSCFGTRGGMQRTEMGEMWVNCNFCMGDGSVSCFTCGGRGHS